MQLSPRSLFRRFLVYILPLTVLCDASSYPCTCGRAPLHSLYVLPTRAPNLTSMRGRWSVYRVISRTQQAVGAGHDLLERCMRNRTYHAFALPLASNEGT
ncbi:hypothetical protein BDB00DRAFT_580613 [Zychaea mexicana]|uniref:uncharacterized protein n=1 Tax=Zychaea mexicana TaxID=64656 RepID=UPI0022FE7930|nr:uncharacterized protein BDB00DRAFT_580613 [Zychaea mexicana]KAI9497561.1 hypothetical protein BDB00DRAFT_580613 [Zychaea mexicana]